MFEPAPLPPEQRSWPRRMLNRWEVDQAVFYAVAYRAWQFLAGPITLVLMTKFFTLEVQGYYYTFWSLIGLQLIFELSLPAVILTTASHEWSGLSLGPGRTIEGDARSLSRLTSLTRTSLAWYGTSAILFVAIVSVGGLYFFDDGSESRVEWRLPWLALTCLTGIVFWLTPLLTILEGCNQVKEVQRYQFARAILGNLIIWCGIPLGAGLWVPAIATLVRLICDLSLVFGSYGSFYRTLFRKPAGEVIDWMKEVWPFQWRSALKCIVAYVNGYLINPVIFKYQGKEAAGQIGFTWSVLTSLQAACSSWVKTRASLFGTLVVRKDYPELDRVYLRVSRIALVAYFLLTAAFVGCVAILGAWLPEYAERLTTPLPTALFCLAFGCTLYNELVWTYINAHRQAPFLTLSVATGLINGLAFWWAGKEFGIPGAAIAAVIVNGVLVAPLAVYTLRYAKKAWHGPEQSG
jgi:hypothetical protein